MRFRNLLLLILASPLLVGFTSKQAEPLIKECVALGHSEKKCGCALDIQEEMLGSEYIEAIYLQAIGNFVEYDKKFLEMVKVNPNIDGEATKARSHAKKQCGF